MNLSRFLDTPPGGDEVTPYDEAQLTNYLRILDADAEGADWREIVTIIFGLDPLAEPDRSRTVHASHLRRARWMVETGYRQLVGKDFPTA